MNNHTSGDADKKNVRQVAGPTTILVVEADHGDTGLLQHLMDKGRDLPFMLESVDTLPKASARIARGDVKVAFVDLDLLAGQKVTFLASLLQQVEAAPIVILAARDDLAPVIASLKGDAVSQTTRHSSDAPQAPVTQSPRDGRPALTQSSDVRKAPLGRATIRWYSQRLLSSEARFRRIIERGADAIVIVSTDGVVRYVNPATEILFDKKAEQIVGSPAGFPLIAGETTQMEVTRENKESAVAEVRVVEIEWQEHPAYLVSLRNITEHKRLEQELHALTGRLVEVQEEERRFVATELHDQVGQYLTGLRISLDMLARLPPARAKAKLKETLATLDELMAQVRNLSLDLRPAMLDDLGLLPALLWYFERYTSQTAVVVSFTHGHLESPMPRHVKIAAFRIVQEALTNVARHAGVKEAHVKAYAHPGILQVEVEDHGIGFDPQKVMALRTCCGLTGMRERATAVGGRLSVEPSPGAGTRVMADLPLVDQSSKERIKVL
ncbi:MAG: PAS domain S-box protein [Chloroflexi bacterium]|nr:PAS domain S-box protein [Chloroflexota bacterium]